MDTIPPRYIAQHSQRSVRFFAATKIDSFSLSLSFRKSQKQRTRKISLCRGGVGISWKEGSNRKLRAKQCKA